MNSWPAKAEVQPPARCLQICFRPGIIFTTPADGMIIRRNSRCIGSISRSPSHQSSPRPEAIRFAKTLRMMAKKLGLEDDVKGYDRDIQLFSSALQTYAWDQTERLF